MKSQMKIDATDADIEYFKKFVNSGNETLVPIQRIKWNTIGTFLLFTFIGMLSSSFSSNSVAIRTVFLVILIGGIVCTIGADKWFSGNRGYLLVVWLGAAGISIPLLLTSMIILYGVSNILIIVFIVIQVVTVIAILNSFIKSISNRRIGKDIGKNAKYYGLGGYGFIGGVIFSRIAKGVETEIIKIIIASLFIVAVTVLWISIGKLIQLYYAVKYNIDVEITLDTQYSYVELSEKHQCSLYGKMVEESLCDKINYENEGMMKPNKLKYAKKSLHMTSEEIRHICKNCKYCPLQESVEDSNLWNE